MTTTFAARVPTLWHGRGITRSVIDRLTAGRDTLVIVDSAVTVAMPAGHRATRTIELDAGAVDASTVAAMAAEVVRRRPEIVVTVGGGTVLDVGKIVALALARGRMLDFALERASTSALVYLPDAAPPIDIIAVPTTVGTSSETNSVGILKHSRGYRLLVGRALRPRHAVLDPDHLRTLTDDAVREGALEAFLRIAGAATSAGRTTRARGHAAALGAALLETASRGTGSADARLRVARLSAATQRGAALRSQDPYSARHWYLANEVAFALGVRKMAATVAVIAAIWRRIGTGDQRWGDRRSLEEFWTRVASAAALPVEPSEGIATLAAAWSIPLPPRPSSADIHRIATTTEGCWGSRYPMLPGLVAGDFIDVLRDSSWSEQPVGGRRRPPTITRKEVER